MSLMCQMVHSLSLQFLRDCFQDEVVTWRISVEYLNTHKYVSVSLIFLCYPLHKQRVTYPLGLPVAYLASTFCTNQKLQVMAILVVYVRLLFWTKALIG